VPHQPGARHGRLGRRRRTSPSSHSRVPARCERIHDVRERAPSHRSARARLGATRGRRPYAALIAPVRLLDSSLTRPALIHIRGASLRVGIVPRRLRKSCSLFGLRDRMSAP
jgi:hypothetical protein